MADILILGSIKSRNESEPVYSRKKFQCEAEIIFFPGVRYERSGAVAPSKVRGRSKLKATSPKQK